MDMKKAAITIISVIASIFVVQAQNNPSIFAIDFVKILNNNQKETFYYYANNWNASREIALAKNYIKSYQLINTKADSAADFDLMLITEYTDSTQYKMREERFASIIKELNPAGPKLLNTIKPNDFRKIVFTKQAAPYTFNKQTQPGLPDEQLIKTTIQLYFDGWATGDTSKIGKAMHSTCHLKFFRDGQFTDMTRAEYLARFKPRQRPDGLAAGIVALDVTGNIASAKTEIDTGKDVFTDYFNLIKTNEGWFIVDKVSVRRTK
jgi:hypothetical protein